MLPTLLGSIAKGIMLTAEDSVAPAKLTLEFDCIAAASEALHNNVEVEVPIEG